MGLNPISKERLDKMHQEARGLDNYDKAKRKQAMEDRDFLLGTGKYNYKGIKVKRGDKIINYKIDGTI